MTVEHEKNVKQRREQAREWLRANEHNVPQIVTASTLCSAAGVPDDQPHRLAFASALKAAGWIRRAALHQGRVQNCWAKAWGEDLRAERGVHKYARRDPPEDLAGTAGFRTPTLGKAGPFRWGLPYSIKRVGDRWLVLNRRYEFIGLLRSRVRKTTLAKLAAHVSADGLEYWLYTKYPEHSPDEMGAYIRRLAVLCALGEGALNPQYRAKLVQAFKEQT